MNEKATINNQQDLDHLLKTNPQTMVLFYSSWCPFCRRFLPAFEKYAGENRNNYTFCLVHDQDALEDQFRVKIVPTVLFFENGLVTRRLDGVSGIGIHDSQLADFINTCGKSK